jgi:hypothetical protein
MMAEYSPLAKIFVGKNMEGTLLDLGCGTLAPIGRMLYVNRRKVKHYIGVDYRGAKPEYNATKAFPCTYLKGDVTTWDVYAEALKVLEGNPPDFITSFECIEHMAKEKGILFLDNIAKVAGPKTTILLSTPCHDGIHLPHDHVFEWRWQELRDELEKRFTIVENYGTFASQRDLLPVLTPEERDIWERLSNFYDSSVLSVIFAPLYPSASRNSLWKLRLP